VVLSGYTPASSTTKTGRHDIAEILLKVALNTKNQTKPIFVLIFYIRDSHHHLIDVTCSRYDIAENLPTLR
jgi:hypothetical protein